MEAEGPEEMTEKVSLELVSSSDLIEELSNRHDEIIVIREYKRKTETDKVFVKTSFGKKGRKEKGFDLIEATSMLHAAHWQLIYDYLDEVAEENGET